MRGTIVEIDSKTATEFLLPKHYSGRKPTITKAYGWFDSRKCEIENLKAVCTFGKPASPFVCEGICGKKYADNVYELNRLCRVDGWNEPLSQFVSAVLRRLRTENWIVVSYSDTAMNHHGYIYQACNFLYTGCSPPPYRHVCSAWRSCKALQRARAGGIQNIQICEAQIHILLHF